MHSNFYLRNLFLFFAITIFLTLNFLPARAQTTPLPGQWTGVTLTTATKINTLLVTSSKILAGTSTGIWQTTDNGVTWTQVNAGLTQLDVRSLALSGTTLYAGTNGGGIFKSTDGTNWTAFNTGLLNGTVYALAASGTDLYAGTFGNGVFLSANGGNWTEANKTISESARIYSLLLNGNDLFAGGTLIINNDHHIFKTSDKGTTWTATGAAVVTANNNPPELVYSMVANGTTLLAGTFNGIYRSTDNGVNWQLLPSLSLPTLSLAYNANKSALYAATTTKNGSPFGVLVSTDNGTTWRAMSYNLPGANSLAITDANIFAGGTSAGTMYTTTTAAVTNASVNAANYQVIAAHTPAGIASLFGPNLATGQAVATTVPLPTALLGTTVTILDSANNSQIAPLFFVSKNQVNYQIPANAANGWALLTVKTGDNVVSYATANITTSGFSLFSADSTGTGVPAAYVQRVRANGSQSFEAVGRFDPTQQKWVPIPIDLGPDTDRVYLVLFGTGIRGWDSASIPVTCYFGYNTNVYIPMQAEYAGPQGDYVGVDQVNLVIPRSLVGAGEVSLYITANTGTFSNTLKINVR